MRRLTVSKNKIKDIYYKPGFPWLYMVAIEDNLINNWKAFDELNKYKSITTMRCGGNPIFEMNEKDKNAQNGRQVVIARMQFLKHLNGSQVDETERKDAQILYTKKSYEEFIRVSKLEKKVENLEDPLLGLFMNENHPRWYELVEIHGSPLEMVNLKQEGTNIASTSAKIKLVSKSGPTTGKMLEKKLLLSMTVSALKAMCSKFFKIEVIQQKLTYNEVGSAPYELEVDTR
jgi:hypothetical protein